MKYLLLLSFFIAQTAFAQKECKMVTNVDEFTGDTTMGTSLFLYGFTQEQHYQWFNLVTVHNENYLVTTFEAEDPAYSDSDDNVILKMEDGSMINLHPYTRSEIEVTSNADYSISVICPINDEDLLKLTQVPILKVRIETDEGYYDTDPVGKKHGPEAMANFERYYKYVGN